MVLYGYRLNREPLTKQLPDQKIFSIVVSGLVTTGATFELDV